MSKHFITVSPTVDTAAYATGDLIGGKNTIALNVASGFNGTLTKVIVRDLAKQSAAMDLVFFNTDPSTTTFTDQAAFDVADADLAYFAGHASVLAANYAAFNDSSAATVSPNLAIGSKSSSLYMAIVSRGTPTYSAGTDLKIDLYFSL